MTMALYATIWMALGLFAVAEAGRGPLRGTRGPAGWAWPALLAGAVLATLHVLIALGARYGWEHDVAVRETARQAAAVYGFEWRGSVYVNYAFVLVWFVEVGRWRGQPHLGVPRSRFAVWVWRGFFLIVILNAAIVFATTPLSRLAGVALVAGLLWAWRPGGHHGVRGADDPQSATGT